MFNDEIPGAEVLIIDVEGAAGRAAGGVIEDPGVTVSGARDIE